MREVKENNQCYLAAAEVFSRLREGVSIDSPWALARSLPPLHDSDNHDGVITHPEPDILECEVKSASGNITTNKVSGGEGIPDRKSTRLNSSHNA